MGFWDFFTGKTTKVEQTDYAVESWEPNYSDETPASKSIPTAQGQQDAAQTDPADTPATSPDQVAADAAKRQKQQLVEEQPRVPENEAQVDGEIVGKVEEEVSAQAGAEAGTEATAAAAIETTPPQPPYLPVLSYPYPRDIWTLTSELAIKMKMKELQFFVGPADWSVNFPLRVGELEQQGGQILTFWAKQHGERIDNSNQNHFPYMDITLTAQLGNVNPFSYTVPNDDGEEKATMPRGVINLYEIMAFLNQPRVLMEDPANGIVEGWPNYMYLTAHTKLFPAITFKGQITEGVTVEESAEEPFLRTVNLTFRATSSVPDVFSSSPAAGESAAARSALLEKYQTTAITFPNRA